MLAVICAIFLAAFTYYVFFHAEGGIASSNRKYYVLLFAVFIRLLASGFVESDNYAWVDYTVKTLEYGYPKTTAEPLYYSYWSGRNPLGVFVQHPPLAFYLYAPAVFLGEHASSLLNMLFFVLSVHVLWNFLERRRRNPLMPSLLYLTFPVFYLESTSLFSFNTLTISVLMVAFVNYLEYSRDGGRRSLYKTVFCLAASAMIDYTSIIVLLFFSAHFMLKNRARMREVLVILAVVWLPFTLWSIYTDFPLFHNYGFTYQESHHMNDTLGYGDAVRQYYSQHAGKTPAYYLMDNPLFAVLNFMLFLNLNILLLGRNDFSELKKVFAAAIILHLLLLTYYAVVKYQSHSIANYVRYAITPMFYLLPLSLKAEYNPRDRKIAYLTVALNLAFILYALSANQFQWVTVHWIRTIL